MKNEKTNGELMLDKLVEQCFSDLDVVGYKSVIKMDSGYFYAPYIPLMRSDMRKK